LFLGQKRTQIYVGAIRIINENKIYEMQFALTSYILQMLSTVPSIFMPREKADFHTQRETASRNKSLFLWGIATANLWLAARHLCALSFFPPLWTRWRATTLQDQADPVGKRRTTSHIYHFHSSTCIRDQHMMFVISRATHVEIK